MGFNKCIVPSIDHMVHEYILKGKVEDLVNRYKKCDCFIGSSESIKVLESVIKEYMELKPHDKLPL